MVTSCFFCQNLLSDYLEGLLPSGRKKEVEAHLVSCSDCGKLRTDLEQTLKLLHQVSFQPLSSELSMQIVECSQGLRRSKGSRPRVYQVALFSLVFAGLVGVVIYAFPQFFPWSPVSRQPTSISQFVRYHPQFLGANDILDEHGEWLQNRDAFMGSLWEEGGLSPEEFEKTFDVFRNGEK